MIDRSQFSQKLLASDDARSDLALERIALAKRRIQSILDRETVCNQKTLEQKISDQGPKPMRVDPVSGHGFGNLTGDALEVIVWKCLQGVREADKRYGYLGSFDIGQPKDEHGRYRKVQPPKSMGDRTTKKEADFIQFGHSAGALCIECKNLREWIYPDSNLIKELIIKASELGCVPMLIARRLHYTTRSNFLEPAGIIAHESLFQYYPPEYSELAAAVKHARSLGFTDVMATEEPHARTIKFFNESLPKIVATMARRWFANEGALLAFANLEINLAQLYTEIGSPAGGKWTDRKQPDPPEAFD